VVQSDSEVVSWQDHLLGGQHHGAHAGLEDAPVLAARCLVAGKAMDQHQGCSAMGTPPAYHLPGASGPPHSPGKEEPGARALVHLQGRPLTVNSEDAIGEASESSHPWPWGWG
jgi:hypothetical protein